MRLPLRLRQPHDRVLPLNRLAIRTTTVVPQSQRTRAIGRFVPSSQSAAASTISRPKRSPIRRVRARDLASAEIRSLLKQPQDFVCPDFRSLPETVVPVPHSQTHDHR